MMIGLRRLFDRVLLGAVALFGLGQPLLARAAWSPNSDDAILLDARLGKYQLGDGVRGYTRPDSICVDMADVVMALDLPIRVDTKLRRATGWAFREERKIVIDREANTVQIMNKIAPLSAGAIVDAPEGWCVDVKALGDWLGIRLQVDQTNALLTIASDAKLPVEMSIERRERAAGIRPQASFDLATLPQSRVPMRGVPMPSVDVVASFGGLRNAQTRRNSIAARYEMFAAGEIGPIAYDARLASNDRGIPRDVRVRAYRTSPQGGLLGPLKATQWALGDVGGAATPLVAQAQAGRGAFVTNRPVKRPDNFDRTNFQGELPVGWDAELYRNGQLLAFANERADGRYEFLDVPLLYGQNRFEVVLYGPQGQVRREERTIPVGIDSIPPRTTYYWAGLSQPGRDLISLSHNPLQIREGWRGILGAERGINARTSVAAWLHTVDTPLDGRLNYGELAVRRAVGPALAEFSVATDMRGGTAFRSQLLGEAAGTSFRYESIFARGGYTSEALLQGVSSTHRLTLDRAIKLGRTNLPITAEAAVISYASGGRATEASLRSFVGIGRIALTNRLDWRHDRTPFGPSAPDQVALTSLANVRIGRVSVRSESRFRIAPGMRLENLNLVGEWGSKHADGRRGNNWRAEIGYETGGRMHGTLGWVREFEKVALTASVSGATDGSVALGLNLAFSIGPDPREGRGLRVTAAPLARNGQLLATVFRDLNDDGIRQADEPVEQDVELTAGRAPVEGTTDQKGQVLVNTLTPFEPVLIGIDTSSLSDPLLQPRGPGLVVTPRPGITARVELPLVSAGEVDGTLISASGNGLQGIDLELVDGEGRVVRATRTEYDGFFLFEGVPYGRYALRVAQASADAARIEARLSAGVTIGGRAPLAHLGAVMAEARVQQAQAP